MMEKPKDLFTYWPLIALIGVALAATGALCLSRECSPVQAMHYLMGLLFCLFALLKLFNISGFADGFQMYDLVAKRFRSYALAYPFIELFLGFAFLSMQFPIATYIATILLMLIGSIGVISALRRGLHVSCACMGTILQVPLSTVTLTEDLGMGIMAFIMLVGYLY